MKLQLTHIRGGRQIGAETRVVEAVGERQFGGEVIRDGGDWGAEKFMGRRDIGLEAHRVHSPSLCQARLGIF